MLVIREQQLGRQHPETAQTLHDLSLLRQKQDNLSEALSLAEHALQIRIQFLGDAHFKTLATQTLHAQLVQECAAKSKASDAKAKKHSDCMQAEHHAANVSLSLSEQVQPLQDFLSACCELHPRACCRVSDLWSAYEQWTAERQECFPLSRRAFTAQLKAHGCYADRTSSARIWRGIALADARTMTENDSK